MYNAHVIDWLSWQLHPGASLTQMLSDPQIVAGMYHLLQSGSKVNGNCIVTLRVN